MIFPENYFGIAFCLGSKAEEKFHLGLLKFQSLALFPSSQWRKVLVTIFWMNVSHVTRLPLWLLDQSTSPTSSMILSLQRYICNHVKLKLSETNAYSRSCFQRMSFLGDQQVHFTGRTFSLERALKASSRQREVTGVPREDFH